MISEVWLSLQDEFRGSPSKCVVTGCRSVASILPPSSQKSCLEGGKDFADMSGSISHTSRMGTASDSVIAKTPGEIS